MTQRTLHQLNVGSFNSTGSWLMLGSALLLSGLAAADRTIVWMIGEFPTSAALWQLRFEYLRPIGVFYDIVTLRFGLMSIAEFNALALLLGLIVGGAAMSTIRLARAVSYHVLLGAALVVTVYSIDPGEGTYAQVGVPSSGYVAIGSLLAMAAATMCARAHAEYIGWRPASSRIVLRLKAAARRRLENLGELVLAPLNQAIPSPHKAQPGLGWARIRNRTSSRR
jgi:hypothetical protein